MGDADLLYEEKLRTQARELIERGALPRDKPVGMWGGRGSGQPCALCDEPILQQDVELELQFALPDGSVTLHLHRRCHLVWEQVRRQPAPSEWLAMDTHPPPAGTPVEARLELGSSRSLILTVIRTQDPVTGAWVWNNVATAAPLPASWRPVEWRDLPGTEPADEAATPDGAALPRRA